MCGFDCNGAGIALSVIFGIIVGVLAFLGNFIVTQVLIWGGLGLALLALVLLLTGSLYLCTHDDCGCKRCICRSICMLIVGIIGTFVTAFISFACFIVPLGAAAVLTAFTGLFTAIIISAFVCISLCLLRCRDRS